MSVLFWTERFNPSAACVGSDVAVCRSQPCEVPRWSAGRRHASLRSLGHGVSVNGCAPRRREHAKDACTAWGHGATPTRVQLETAGRANCAHAGPMNLLYVKGIIGMSWACSVLAAGLLARAGSLTDWVTLTLLAAVPPSILMHRWNEPLPSTSQHIQQALR